MDAAAAAAVAVAEGEADVELGAGAGAPFDAASGDGDTGAEATAFLGERLYNGDLLMRCASDLRWTVSRQRWVCRRLKCPWKRRHD